MEGYEAALASHDWYYNFSDDGRVWRAGEDAFKELVAMHRAQSWLIGRKAADALWIKHAPEGYLPPQAIATSGQM